MTDEQLVELACAGDLEAADSLIRRIMPILVRRARALYGAGVDRDDLIQEGAIALYAAIYQYRPDRQPKFRPFGVYCAVKRMQTAVRAALGQRVVLVTKAVSIDAWVERESEPCHVPELPIWEVDRMVSSAGLTPLEESVVRGIADGLSYKEIGQRLGCHNKRVDNALQRAKRKVGRVGEGSAVIGPIM